MISRPYVVEELNLRNRFQPPSGQPNGAADDVCLGQRGVEHACATESTLQIESYFEDPALSFYLLDVFFAAAIGYVFTKHDDALVSSHFIVKTGVNQIEHGFRRASILLDGGRCGARALRACRRCSPTGGVLRIEVV